MANLANNPFNGLRYLLQGFRLITQPGLRRFVIIPTLINISVFIGLGYFAFNQIDIITESYIANLPDWLQWLDWIAEFAIVLFLGVIAFFSFTLIANLICAPFNGPLAEAVHQRLTGQTTSSPWHESITTLPATFADEFRKMFYAVSRSLPFLLLFLLPGINVIASLLWMIFAAWLLALQYLDYPLGNRHIRFAQQRALLGQYRWLTWGFGGGVLLCTLIPVLNLLIIPAAVAGATALQVKEIETP
ncbi:MAG: sulfate transporter CysZ [Gammaproteobacteria bacterium]|nr:sulfate transporter CysZ [Gammaproteobacteria bacterium]